MQSVEVIAADTQSFSDWGRFVGTPMYTPTSEDETYKFWSDIAAYHIEGETEIGICQVYQQNQNLVSGFERHLSTPEILIPMDAPFVLPLLKDEKGQAAIEAFYLKVGEAVVINTGIWHGACLPVGTEQSSYFVIFKRGTPENDVQKLSVDAQLVDISNFLSRQKPRKFTL